MKFHLFKQLFALGVVSALATLSMSQTKTLPTLEDLLPGGANYRPVENISGLQWWGDVCVKPAGDRMVTISLLKGKETTLFTLEALNQALSDRQLEPRKSLSGLSFPWKDRTCALVTAASNYAIYNWKTKQIVSVVTLKKGAANPDYTAQTGHAAYTIGNNLYVDDTQVTDEPKGIVCGQSVHRNEFGISKGTFWSPKGNLLAFYRMDESMVAEYPLVNIDAREAELNAVRYPMAGMTSHKVSVGIYNPQTRQTVYLATGDPTDRYFTNLSWSPDEKSLYLIELNRDQNHARLCRYNAADGKLEATLLEETHPKYVEPQHPIVFLPWDSSMFIYQSQRDGFNHLYLYDTGGKLIKQLTQGNWLVQSIVGFNEKTKEIVYTSTQESPLQSNVYRVSVENGKISGVGYHGGVHTAQLSASGTYLIDRYTTPTVPRNIEVYALHSHVFTLSLLKAEDPYKDFILPRIEVGTLKAADGKTDLYYRLCKPADFDPAKKYPAIIYVYGGPHAQMIHDNLRYDARGWDLYMANKGYIMLTVDNRGSDNRGLEFENATFRHLGVEEGKDQMKGVEFLKSLPYVDASRIGVHGWSFGGHMTTALMLRYPDTFKAGVAGGPVIDWQYYEIMYGERYMDTPQTNPEGYEETDLRRLAGNLKGRLLVVFGYQDATCVPQHSLSFMKACVDARVYPDLFIYPGHEHNMVGRDRVHLHEKITRYFEDYLK